MIISEFEFFNFSSSIFFAEVMLSSKLNQFFGDGSNSALKTLIFAFGKKRPKFTALVEMNERLLIICAMHGSKIVVL